MQSARIKDISNPKEAKHGLFYFKRQRDGIMRNNMLQ